MQKIKKLICLLLTLALVLGMSTVSFAADVVEADTKEELVAALTEGKSVKLTGDIDFGEFYGNGVTVKSGADVTLDLNGYTIEGIGAYASSSVKNINMIVVPKETSLTIEDANGTGQILLSATSNRGWNNSASVIMVGGTLTVNSGTIRNQGGTDMTFGISMEANGGAAPNPVLNMTGGVVRSDNYIGIRAFINSAPVEINITGGTVYGYNRGVWMQQPTGSRAGVNTAELNISNASIAAETAAAVDVWMVSPGTGEEIVVNIDNASLSNASDSRATVTVRGTDGSVATADVNIASSELYNSGTAGNVDEYRTAITTPQFTVADSVTMNAEPAANVLTAESGNPTVDTSAEAPIIKYGVTNTLKNVTTSGADEVYKAAGYAAILTAANGYKLPSAITVKVGGEVITSGYTYDSTTGEILIPSDSVTGDIEISAKGISLTMTAPVITKQPADVTVVEGKEFAVVIEATGEELVYTWQASVDGTVWETISGYNEAELPGVTAEGDAGITLYVRCIVSNDGGEVVSETAKISCVTAQTTAPETGDYSSAALWLCLMVVCFGIMASAAYTRSRR